MSDELNDVSSDEKWNAGCDFALMHLCTVLRVDPETVTWDAATETVDGDVQSVIGNILRAKFGENWSPTAVNSIDRITAERDALKAAAENFVAKVDRGEARSRESYAEFKSALTTPLTGDDSNGVDIAGDGAL